MRLVVVSEGVLDNPATLPTLNHLITADTAYQRQGGEQRRRRYCGQLCC